MYALLLVIVFPFYVGVVYQAHEFALGYEHARRRIFGGIVFFVLTVPIFVLGIIFVYGGWPMLAPVSFLLFITYIEIVVKIIQRIKMPPPCDSPHYQGRECSKCRYKDGVKCD